MLPLPVHRPALQSRTRQGTTAMPWLGTALRVLPTSKPHCLPAPCHTQNGAHSQSALACRQQPCQGGRQQPCQGGRQQRHRTRTRRRRRQYGAPQPGGAGVGARLYLSDARGRVSAAAGRLYRAPARPRLLRSVAALLRRLHPLPALHDSSAAHPNRDPLGNAAHPAHAHPGPLRPAGRPAGRRAAAGVVHRRWGRNATPPRWRPLSAWPRALPSNQKARPPARPPACGLVLFSAVALAPALALA